LLTIFIIPKAFEEHISVIQKNALRSWQQLKPSPEILIFGDDIGVESAAKELGITHVPFIERNKFGTPLLSSAFSAAQEIASNNILVYANSDIIFFQDLIEAVKKIDQQCFLACGRRWDLDVTDEIDFSDDEWDKALLTRVKNEGQRHGLSGIDYFIFRRNSVDMPPFAVGRPGWDGWLIYEMRRKEIPVIDATEANTVVHQNHDYSHSQFGEKKRVGGPERAENIKIAGGFANFMTLRDADRVLTKDGLRRPDFPARIFTILSLWYPWRLLLATKRRLQNGFHAW
jgi:hypothetical protein